MKKILMVALTALCMMQAQFLAQAGSFNSQGVFSGTVDARVSDLFKKFPNGGNELAEAIAALLTNNPTLADDVAQVAKSANAAQQAAAGTGMGTALEAITDACSKSPCSAAMVGGPSGIARAIRFSGSATLLAAAVKAAPAYLTDSGTYIPPSIFVALNRSTLTSLGLCTGSPC